MKHLIWPVILLALFVGYKLGVTAEKYKGRT